MASRVGTAALLEDDSNGTAIVSSSITVQAGDMVVFGSKHETDPGGGTTTTITVTASGGNGTATNGTYKEHTNEGLFTQMAYLLITAGGSITFTQTLTAARRFRRFYIEVFRPGASTTLGFDAENPPAEGTGTTAMSGGTNALTYSATGFAIAFFGEFSGVTYTAGSGWTASGVSAALMEYRTTSGSGTLTCNATCSSAMDWNAHGMSFKETASGSTYTLTCDQASYGLTGNATGLLAGRKITCDQQSYALTGQAVTLTYTSGGARTLTCDQASYTLTGFDTVLSPQSPPAFYTLTGTDVGLLASTRVLTCVQASYGLTGNATNFLTTHALTCDQASYTLTGPATNLVYSNAPATSGVGIDSVRARLRPYLGVKRRMVAVGL